ncbi:MAG: M3 family oligoendopeptidase, partial [Shimia sp.]
MLDTAAAPRDLGDLPEWDLTDLYAAPDAAELSRDMEWLATACADFAEDYEGELNTLSADELLKAVREYEA